MVDLIQLSIYALILRQELAQTHPLTMGNIKRAIGNSEKRANACQEFAKNP